jgi:hypothetical protein
MIYAIVLFLHSWLRWAVVLTGVALLARAVLATVTHRPWQPLDRRLALGFVSALDSQVLLGLLLYFFLSPITPRSLADFRTFMPISPLRFFAIEHPVGMLVALVAAHVGWARSKRAGADPIRWRQILIGTVLALLALLISIPWPWLAAGRPLVRGL